MSQTWIVPVYGLAAGLREADFHRGECAGVIGADGVSGGLAGVAVEAAGDVDGELFAGLGVHPVDGGVEWRARFAGGAGAEHGVDEPAPRCVRAEQVHVERSTARVDERSMIGTSVFCRIAKFVAASPRSSLRRAEQQHAAIVAADFEVPGDDEAVAGVVAFAAEDDDRAVDAEPLQHVDATAAGVFHQHEAGDAVLFDGAAIDFAALVAGEDASASIPRR